MSIYRGMPIAQRFSYDVRVSDPSQLRSRKPEVIAGPDQVDCR